MKRQMLFHGCLAHVFTCKGNTCPIGRPGYGGCPCSMFLMGIEAGAVSSVPYLDRCIITGGGEAAAIRGPGNIAYLLVMPLVGKQNLPGGSIQNFCRGISIGQGKTPTVRGPGNRVYPDRARFKP